MQNNQEKIQTTLSPNENFQYQDGNILITDKRLYINKNKTIELKFIDSINVQYLEPKIQIKFILPTIIFLLTAIILFVSTTNEYYYLVFFAIVSLIIGVIFLLLFIFTTIINYRKKLEKRQAKIIIGYAGKTKILTVDGEQSFSIIKNARIALLTAIDNYKYPTNQIEK